MYLLRKLPAIFTTQQEIESIPPVEFCEKGVKRIRDCMLEIRRKFIGVNEAELAWWIDWEKKHVPVLTSAVDYVRQLKGSGYHTPLAGYLFGKLKPVNAVWRSKLTADSSDINKDFQWPEILAAATQSVRTDFNRHAPEPRVITVNQNDLIDTIKEVYNKVNSYYTSIVTSLTNDVIKVRLNQKIQPSGCSIATANKNKACLIEMWKQHDRACFEAIFSKLSPVQLAVVEPLCLRNHADINAMIVSQKNNISFNRLILKEINGELPLNAKGMNSLLKLFRKRDEIIVGHNSSYKRSIFIDVETCTEIMNYNIDSDETQMLLIDPQFGNLTQSDLEKLCRIYLPYLHSNVVWGMVIIDFASKTLYYVYHGIEEAEQELDRLLEKVCKQFSTLLNEIDGVDNNGINDWDISLYPLNASSCPEEFSGIFVATVLYYLVQECPIYIPVSQMSNLKQKFAYWLICGALPM
jgi:hypothetical protein